MAEGKQVASVYVDIGANTTGFQKGAASVTGGIKNLAGAFGVLMTTAAIAKGVFDFSAEAAKLERLADSGTEMARQFGGDMDLIVQKVREASLGTVSEMDIIASSNRAMLLGLGADADKLANLMEVAALRGRAMGLDTTKAFNDIVTGVGRASPLILDNLGIVINAKETYSKYAEGIGKTASELTKAEKTQALLNAVLADGNKMLKEAGGLALDNAGKVEKMNAAWKNFSDNRKRENADLAGSFAESAAVALDGWDQVFKVFHNQNEIVERAGQLRDSLDPGGRWQDFYETARIEWAAQQKGIADTKAELEHYAEAAAIAEEELKSLSKANASIIDGAIDITARNKDYAESQQEILDKIAETRAEGEKLYPWEAQKIEENKKKLEELNQSYADNTEAFREAMAEKFTLYAVEQIALSDGIEGFSQAEYERARIILETTDTATAAAFEEQQAMMLLAQAVTEGIIPVEEWGAVMDQVMADGVASVEEVQAAIDAVPKENTITFDIVTNGAPPNLDTAGGSAPVGTRKTSGNRASGGQVWANESYVVGEQGLEIFTPNQNGMITPNSRAVQQTSSKPDNSALIKAIEANRIDEKKLARTLTSAIMAAGR